MRAITIRPPWSWAIAAGHKDVENRTRCIVGTHRGPVAIHAGKKWDDAGLEACTQLIGTGPHSGPCGAVIAVADLVDVHRAAPDCGCSAWAQPDRWHLVLRGVVELPVEVPCRGLLGLWTLPPDVEAAVHDQLDRLVVKAAVHDVIANARGVQ